MNRRDFLVRSAAGAIGAALLPADAMGDQPCPPAPPGPFESEPAPERPLNPDTYDHVAAFRLPSGELTTIRWLGSPSSVVRIGDLPMVYHHTYTTADQHLDLWESGV